MAEYIERKKFLSRLNYICNAYGVSKFIKEKFKKAIYDCTAADVVEVVRCKNCEHLTKKGICEKFRQRYPFYPEADFHCGFGKRKEGAEE